MWAETLEMNKEYLQKGLENKASEDSIDSYFKSKVKVKINQDLDDHMKKMRKFIKNNELANSENMVQNSQNQKNPLSIN